MKALIAVALLTLVLLSSTSVAGAASTQSIKGVVVDGTAGAVLPTGLVVQLHEGGSATPSVVDRTTQAAADGTFAFSDVPVDPGFKYHLRVDYGGATYDVPVPAVGSDSSGPISVKVFEPTTSEDVLRIDSANWVIQSIDDQAQQVVVLETINLNNVSDRSYVGDYRGDPGSDSPGVLPRTLRLYLPRGASEFQPLAGLDPASLLPVAGGFVDTKPIQPGIHQIAYTYQIAYADGGMEIQKALPYPAAKLRVLAPNAGLEYRSDRLAAAGTLDLQGRPYLVLSADQVPANVNVTLDALGFPVSTVGRLDPNIVQAVGLAIVAIAIVAALVLGLRPFRSSRDNAIDPRQEILRSIARLDAQHADGRIDQHRYESERSQQKQSLLTLATGGAQSTSNAGSDG